MEVRRLCRRFTGTCSGSRRSGGGCCRGDRWPGVAGGGNGGRCGTSWYSEPESTRGSESGGGCCVETARRTMAAVVARCVDSCGCGRSRRLLRLLLRKRQLWWRQEPGRAAAAVAAAKARDRYSCCCFLPSRRRYRNRQSAWLRLILLQFVDLLGSAETRKGDWAVSGLCRKD